MARQNRAYPSARPLVAGLLASVLCIAGTPPVLAAVGAGGGFSYLDVVDMLPAECRTPLARELALISVHADDPLMEENFELANFCGAQAIVAIRTLEEQSAATTFSATAALADTLEANTPPDGLINFETPHVHPIDLTPDGNTLLAVNTAAHRLEIFSVEGNAIRYRATVPVGIDPVTVRARNNNEVWVVNHISDSVSIVDLQRETVVRTLFTDNEPADVVFAANRAFVSASEANRINVFELGNLDAAPVDVRIQGEDPRALAVSADGSTVYAAVFESGNNTGIQGTTNRRGGSIARGVGLADNDVALIDTVSLNVLYRRGLMNMVMGLAVNPTLATVAVVGTEATNEINNEPVLNGKFLRVQMARFSGAGSSGASTVDLNPLLDYQSSSVSASLRSQSIGDPRGVAYRDDGSRLFVTGMGSNNVIVTDEGGARVAQFDVGEGPTGIVLKSGTGIGFVMNKFDGSVSVIDTNNFRELSRSAFYDPTPDAVKAGRPFLYDTHNTSGPGHLSCASCHVDGRTDRLGWQLSDPSAATRTINRASNSLPGNVIGTFNVSGSKTVMVTQTLIDIMDHPNFHWRGDRGSIDEFNGTYANLMGRASQISSAEMAAFKGFLETTWLPPNPYRRIDNSRPGTVTLPDGTTATSNRVGSNTTDALRGGGNTNNCLACHSGQGNATRNFGANDEIGSTIVAPALPALYDKIGFTFGRSGFGFFHNGATDLFEAARTREFLAEILTLEGPDGPLQGAEQRKAPHAGMGQQITLNGAIGGAQSNRLNQLFSIANGSPWVELIAQTRIDGLQRGFLLTTGTAFAADRVGESTNRSALESLAESGTPVTFTLVADDMGKRVALDIDNNGLLDGDERERLSCGTASFDAAVDRALFTWADCDGQVFVVGAGGNAFARYTGRIASDTTLDLLTLGSVEASDSIQLSGDGKQIEFNIGLGGIWVDDFSFTPSDADSLCMVIESQSSNTQVLVGPNRIASGGSFNPATLQSCTMPPPYVDPGGNTPECGDPLIDPSTDAGVFVWQECGGPWNLMLTGVENQGSTSVAGSIGTAGSLSDLTDVSVEGSDTLLATSDSRVRFDLTTGYPWNDRFSLDASADICIALDAIGSGLPVQLGRNRLSLADLSVGSDVGFNPATGDGCTLPDDSGGGFQCGNPNVDVATDDGFFIWQECDGTWVVLMTGVVTDPDRGVRFVGSIASDAGFDTVTPLKMESSDTLDAQGTLLEFNATTGYPWEDRFSFRVADDATLCVALDERPSQLSAFIGANRTEVGARFDPRDGGNC